jgi:hypothetical protein
LGTPKKWKKSGNSSVCSRNNQSHQNIFAVIHALYYFFLRIRISGNIVFQLNVAVNGPFVFLYQFQNIGNGRIAFTPGHICIGGVGIFSGFVFQMNAENLVVQPFTSEFP